MSRAGIEPKKEMVDCMQWRLKRMANLSSFDNDTVEIGGRVDYKLAGGVHAKVEPEEMFFG